MRISYWTIARSEGEQMEVGAHSDAHFQLFGPDRDAS